MNGVKYLIGSDNICTSPLKIFDEEFCAFTFHLSEALMKDPLAKKMPDVLSLAFWCRKANILKLKQKFPEEENRIGRGLAFHITPSNVAVNFAFSLIFAGLSGNANLVRIPSQSFPQVATIIEVISNIIANYPEIEKRTTLVSYPQNEHITSEYSLKADLRIIWGGDETIKHIRTLTTKPRCLDICFPDRYSIAIFDGQTLEKSDEQTIEKLATNFYNDTYLMDQNACSSPHIIFWLNPSPGGKNKFWASLENIVQKRFLLPASAAMDKFSRSCLDAVLQPELIEKIIRHDNYIYRIVLKRLPDQNIEFLRGSFGYFYEYDLSNLNDLHGFISEKFQTVTYFGLNPLAIRNFIISKQISGIDRIVPSGSALDLNLIWDGFDLVRSFSRTIDIVIHN